MAAMHDDTTHVAGDLRSNRNFQLLWWGQGVSVLGDQFYLIALPWLVLQLTGDPRSMAGVLAAAAVPRALLMLVGGLLSDRFSSQRVMIVSNLARFVVVGALSVMVAADAVDLMLLYVCAFFFGVADALFYPAELAILPKIVPAHSLPRANALVAGATRLAALFGPMAAGLLIAGQIGATGAGGPERSGMAAAFAVDAVTFLISLLTLAQIRQGADSAAASEPLRS